MLNVAKNPFVLSVVKLNANLLSVVGPFLLKSSQLKILGRYSQTLLSSNLRLWFLNCLDNLILKI
jgi:hypothetical protein